MKKITFILIIIILCILTIFGIFFGITNTGKCIWNSWEKNAVLYDEQYLSVDNTYQLSVEYECRTMLTEYNLYKHIYELYRYSDNEKEKNISTNAKDLVNYTARKYNKFVNENIGIWNGNVPKYIKVELPIIE